MELNPTDLQNLHDQAVTAARRASEHIRAEVGKPREVMDKEGHTLASQVVTEVDFECQRLILESLAGSRREFGLGLLTEESPDDSSRRECGYFWCIDPIDGTLPFIENVPGYSVSIGLVSRAGIPVVGVVLDPESDTLYSAFLDGGARRNGEAIGELASGGDAAVTLVTDRSLTEQENYPQVLSQLQAANGGGDGVEMPVIKQGGAAMNACWVIDHAPAVYFKMPKPQRGGGALWDFAATACVFGELEGAVVSDFQDQPLKLNREGCPYMNKEGVIYTSNPALAEAVRGLVGG